MRFKIFPLLWVGLAVFIGGSVGTWARSDALGKPAEDWCLHHCSRLHQKCSTLLPEQAETCYIKCWTKAAQHPSVAQCKSIADKKIRDILKHLDHEPPIRVVVSYEGRAEQEMEKKSLALQKWKKVLKKIMHLIKSTAGPVLEPETEKKEVRVPQYDASPIYGRQKHSTFFDEEPDQDDFVPRPTLAQVSREKKQEKALNSELSPSVRTPKYGPNFRRDRF